MTVAQPRASLAILVLLVWSLVPGSARGAAIELALVLDSSGSISPTEWTLQQEGYANALATVGIPLDGSVAISVTRFATTGTIVRELTTINDQADLTALTTFFANLPQSGNGGFTCVSCGIELGQSTLTGTATLRSLIDVSTDGIWNRGFDPGGDGLVVGSSAWAVANGVTAVNTLGIGVEPTFAAGANSFTLTAPNFNTFESTLLTKLDRELDMSTVPVPEPTMLTLFGVGLLAVRHVRRRRP